MESYMNKKKLPVRAAVSHFFCTLSFAVEVVDEGMSVLTRLFLFVFSVVGLVVFIVAFLFIYARWKERSRKRFY